MISNTAQINTFIGGMDTDTDVNILPNDRYRYAENVRVITNDGGTTGVLQNIEGVRKYSTLLPEGEIVIGTTTIKDIGVIITKLENGYNRIYKARGFDGNMPTIQLVLQGDLKLCEDVENNPNLSIVGNYESETNVKIYFTDGYSSIKTINIMSDKYAPGSDLVDEDGNILNPEAIDLTPAAKLAPFSVTDLTFGNLPVGVVQYCYQLFNVRGTETVTSPVSQIVHLTQSNTTDDSQQYEGAYPDTSSGKACVLTADLFVQDFQKARIIRIRYKDNISMATIDIVDEIDIAKGQSKLTYVDSGNSFLSELTIDEFNALTGYQFIATTLAKLNNRLFAANLTDDTWEVSDYDARAYRFNSNQIAKLESATGSQDLSIRMQDEDLLKVPANHDCVNPYNSVEYATSTDTNRYIYGKRVNGKDILGGYGINIEYNFCTTPIQLSDRQEYARLDNNTKMNVRSKSMNSTTVKNIGTDAVDHIPFNVDGTQSRIPNYADPYIDAHFRGYCRDEVYRFGIVFYNNKMIASPVYWIGDIKMPHADQIPPFVYENNTLIGQALGINFKVKSMPKDAIAYEIVRCNRTEADRSIIMQCVGSNLYEYRIQENANKVGSGSALDSSIEMRPPYFMTYLRGDIKTWTNGANTAGGADWTRFYIDDKPTPVYVENYLKLVSPEICVSKQAMEKYFKDSTYLDTIGMYASPIYLNNSDRSVTAIFAKADKVLQYDGSIKSVSSIDNIVKIEDNMPTVRLQCRDIDGNSLAYNANIAKYYYPRFDNSIGKTDKIIIKDAKYPLDIPYNSYHDVSPYRINVGDRTFVNYAMSNYDKSNDQVTCGAGGPCIIVHTEDLDKYSPRYNALSGENLRTLDAVNAIPVFNVKRSIAAPYGGNTYASRQNSVYISVNSYNTEPASQYTYGGDTFLNLLDYPNMFTFQANSEKENVYRRRFVGAYIPFESSVNMNLFNGDMAHRTYTSDNYLDTHMQLDPTQKGVYHAQDRPYFLYNSVYSVKPTTKKFVPDSIYSEHYYINSDGEQVRVNTPNRILSSQAKTNNEVIDNWTKFKIADFLDVDNQWGEITNLKTFKDRLFYFQNTGLGIAAVNERSLITDDNVNQLVLGTGGVLARYDYVTNTNGDSVRNDRSIVSSDNVLYWYDTDKNEICSYTGQVSQLSKEKQVQTYLNATYKDKKGNVNSLFDKKYNEVWFSLLDKSLIFNEQLGRFTSFYTFNPKSSLPFSDRVVGIVGQELYSINDTNTKGIDNTDKNAKLQVVINKDVQYTKVFDNVRFNGQFKDKDGNTIKDRIFDYIKFGTKNQYAILEHKEAVIDEEGNVTTPEQPIVLDYREDTYRMPVPRADINEDELSLPARLRGKYMTCDYHFNGKDGNTFEIPQITTTYRYSLI